MPIHTLLRTALLSLLLLTSTASAEALTEPLTEPKVRGFISSLAELQTMEEEFADLTGDLGEEAGDAGMPDLSSIMSDSVRQFRDHPAYDRLDEVVSRHGFDSPEDWGATGDRVFMAWMAIQMQGQRPGIQQEMAQALAEIDNNPNLTAAQKEQMRALMGGAVVAMEQIGQAPEEDIRAVRPHAAELRAITEAD